VTPFVLVVPLALQATAMLFDELHFHRKRGLGTWERIGHPLDTMTVIACMGFVLLIPPTPRTLAVYVVLALFSCAFVTKDELVHARHCSAGEHWLHAVLFVLHPICFVCLGLLWTADSAIATRLVVGQLVMTFAFCLYQILYWNLPWHSRPPRV
jgi:hypothetical protein